MSPNRGNKWDTPALRAAAIDYCVAQMPPPASLGSLAGQDWLQRCSAQCGPQLGLPARDLADILSEYRAPDSVRLPDAPAAAELPEHVVTQSALAAGLATPQETALEALLRAEDGMDEEARSSLLRGILQWICPQLTQPVYTVHRARLTLSDRCRIDTIPAIGILQTPYRTLNRQHIRITQEDGSIHIFLYSSLSEHRSRTPGTRNFLMRTLEPRGNQYDDHTIRKNLTLLTAYINRDRRAGTSWAQAFNETRSMVSVRRRRLTDRLNQTGGRSNLPGMKPHRDPRRGTTKRQDP